MTPITTFDQLRERVQQSEPSSLVVAGGNDENVIAATVQAVRENLVSVVHVTGDSALIAKHLPGEILERFSLINATDAADCAEKAVSLVRDGAGDLLMKGHLDSTAYLRAIVSRDTGIRVDGAALSNLTIAEMPSLPRLIGVTDNGIIPAPDLDQKRKIILNARNLFRGLGIDPVRVAAVAATEKVSKKLPATTDAATLTEDAKAGKLPGTIVDGPFGYDVAISAKSAAIKKLSQSDVAGRADLLLFPTIESGNAVAKAWKFHGQAKTGSVVAGAQVPVMLNSRSDNSERRVNALLLAIAMKLGATRAL